MPAHGGLKNSDAMTLPEVGISLESFWDKYLGSGIADAIKSCSV
jgi:hypothetical protein